jgi:hypothetical protein
MFKRAFLSVWESSEEYTEEEGTSNFGEMPGNNVSIEEENTVEDEDNKDLDADLEEVSSAIQARTACMFALLNKCGEGCVVPVIASLQNQSISNQPNQCFSSSQQFYQAQQ